MMNPQPHKFPYKWNLSDGYPAKNIESHNKTVFSTFSCGGGSTMGYKLAGFKVIGANDIDNQMRLLYTTNHHPKYYVFGDIRKLLNKNYPDEFYNLDLLDGSPPCSTFSMAGSREGAWGVEKQFREGQARQTLDDLFFDFIALAKKLQPKTIIAENVKGLISGNAKGYFIEIVKQFNEAGYDVQTFLFNGSTMGLPQARERVFLLCSRKDLKLPKITMSFDERPIVLQEAISDMPDYSTDGRALTPVAIPVWEKTKIGSSAGTVMNGSWFSRIKLDPNRVAPTITAKSATDLWHWEKPYFISSRYLARLSSFPDDYDFINLERGYVVGMSVPPVMMAQVAHQVYLQWLKNR